MKKLPIAFVLVAPIVAGCAGMDGKKYEEKVSEVRANPALCDGVDVAIFDKPANGLYLMRTDPEKWRLQTACYYNSPQGQIVKAQDDAEAKRAMAQVGLLALGAAADSVPTTYTSNVKLSDGSKYQVKHRVYSNRATSAAVSAITGMPSAPRVHQVDSEIKRVD